MCGGHAASGARVSACAASGLPGAAAARATRGAAAARRGSRHSGREGHMRAVQRRGGPRTWRRPAPAVQARRLRRPTRASWAAVRRGGARDPYSPLPSQPPEALVPGRAPGEQLPDPSRLHRLPVVLPELARLRRECTLPFAEEASYDTPRTKTRARRSRYHRALLQTAKTSSRPVKSTQLKRQAATCCCRQRASAC